MPPDSPSPSLVVWPLHGLTQPLARGQASPALGSPKNAFRNASMDRFQENTDNNILGVSETRCRPGAPFIPQRRVHLERNVAAIAKPLVRSPLYSTVAFLSGTAQDIMDCAPSLGYIAVLKQTSS